MKPILCVILMSVFTAAVVANDNPDIQFTQKSPCQDVGFHEFTVGSETLFSGYFVEVQPDENERANYRYRYLVRVEKVWRGSIDSHVYVYSQYNARRIDNYAIWLFAMNRNDNGQLVLGCNGMIGAGVGIDRYMDMLKAPIADY